MITTLKKEYTGSNNDIEKEALHLESENKKNKVSSKKPIKSKGTTSAINKKIKKKLKSKK